MTRKDSEKDVDRPHYYSQFWLDIAAGRRVIGGPRPEEEAAETEAPEPPAVPTRKNGRNSTADSYKETRPIAAPARVVDEEVTEPSEEELQQDDLVDEDEIPNILLDEADSKMHDDDEEEDEIVDEDEEEDDDEDEEEEEEWNGRGGRKKAKPTRPAKPTKKPKTRRTNF